MKKKFYLYLLFVLLLLPFSVNAEELPKIVLDYIGKNTILYTADTSDQITLRIHTTDTLAEEQYDILYKVGDQESYSKDTCYVSYLQTSKYYKCDLEIDKSTITDSEWTVSAKLQQDGKDVTEETSTTFLVYEDQTLTDSNTGVSVSLGSFPYNAKMTVSTDLVGEIQKQSNASTLLYYTIRVYASDGTTLADQLIDKYDLSGAYISSIEIALPSSYTKTKDTAVFLFNDQYKFLSNAVDKYKLDGDKADDTKVNFTTSIYGNDDYNDYDYLMNGYIVIAELGAFNTNNLHNSSSVTPTSNSVENPNTADSNILLLVAVGCVAIVAFILCSKKIRKVK